MRPQQIYTPHGMGERAYPKTPISLSPTRPSTYQQLARGLQAFVAIVIFVIGRDLIQHRLHHAPHHHRDVDALRAEVVPLDGHVCQHHVCEQIPCLLPWIPPIPARRNTPRDIAEDVTHVNDMSHCEPCAQKQMNKQRQCVR